jgi:hypothetical protein
MGGYSTHALGAILSRRNKNGLDDTCAAQTRQLIVKIYEGATKRVRIDAPTACFVPVLPVMICVAGRASANHDVIIVHS